LLDLAAGEAGVVIRIAKMTEDDRLVCRKPTTITASLYAAHTYADRYRV